MTTSPTASADQQQTSQKTQEQDAQDDKRRKGKRRLWLTLLLLVVVLAAIAVGAWYYLYGRWSEATDDAYVGGNQVQITPETGGTVTSITADDGDYVAKGQVLVSLDRSDAQIALESAEANLAQTVRQVRGLYSNVDQYKAEVETRKVDVQRAQADYDRRRKLADKGAISQEELIHARETLLSAKSALIGAEQQLNTSLALTDNTEVASHPQVMAAAAQVRQAYLDQVRSTIVAPVSGYVAQRSVQVGQRVASGTTLMAVVPLDQVWVDANFKETQLGSMRIGQPVTLVSDLYGDDVTYHGTIENLGVGTGSAFSALPAQNATGNWIKIVQRLPVRIQLDPQELEAYPLRIGLSMTVDVDLHHKDGVLLPDRSREQPRYETDVYAQQLAGANALIEKLIEDNGRQLAQSASGAKD
ncbi:efflux RND transporter periplasmic adaptor subunit [Phytohalomonas tamaricis]|uniref:efflux RND transporter periplasmic adaptor subunit n=1 Tax=Phytohalomonas tamaricis TaxID=2081032 RepID=UPI000D0BA846|nr:HlyD family efflux transporter periplasmic adaptor subunit [Phytohalomonas tamaricis]